MRRILHFPAAASLQLLACAVPWQQVKTPSGIFCSDMPIVPANEKPDRPVHRLGPVASAPECRTEAERLQSLRQIACGMKADAIVEAVNEETKQADKSYLTVSSGTAIQWVAATPAATSPTSNAESTQPTSATSATPATAASPATDEHAATSPPSSPESAPLLREATPDNPPAKKKKIK